MSIGHLPGNFVQRSPKLLSKQAGDRFALEVIKRSIEPISKGLNQDYDDPEVWPEIIEQLKTIKSWYWGAVSEWVGYGCSKLRCMLSKSFMDLLDLRKKYRKCPVLQRFIIQILFCCEVGNFERPQETEIERKVCAHLTNFISQLGPFYFEELYETSLKFESGKVMVTLLSQSSELKRIHLRHSITPSCFLPLNNCRNLEVVTIDIENVYNESFDTLRRYLLKTFFGNDGKGLIDFRSLPFPHLKAVCIRYDRFPEKLLDILFLLQQCPNIITQQTCLISLPFNTVQKKIPFVCPTMLIGKDADFKRVQVFLRTPVSGSCVARHENFIEATSSISRLSQDFTLSVHNVQNAIGSLQSLDSLRYIYFDKGMAVVSTAEGVISEALGELYVFGTLEVDGEVQNLVKVLNSCPRLQVLCLQLEIKIEPGMRLLNLMKHLRILSVSLKRFSDPRKLPGKRENLPPDENSISFIMSIIRAAPNVDVLEIPVKYNLPAKLQLDLVLKVETLILTDGDVEEVKAFLRNLPSLSVLMLSADIERKKCQKIKKAYKGTQLEVIVKNTRAVFPFTL